MLEEAANKQDEVLSTPDPKVVLKGLEDGNVQAELQYWIRDSSDVKNVKSQVLEEYISLGVEKGLITEEKEGEEEDSEK
ncbi:MAG: hypothetical protein ABEK04_02150 [Candidatus Nanohalobium sp.]